MREIPAWLKYLESSPAGAEVAAGAKGKDLATTFLELYHQGLEKIESAWENGEIDNQYIHIVFSDIYDLLRYAIATDKTTPLIYRQRTVAEAYREFPQPPNPDASKNFSIAVSAEMQARPLTFDLMTNSGPTIVIAEQYQLNDFLDAFCQSSRLTNPHSPVAIHRDDTSALPQLADQAIHHGRISDTRNIIIASLSPQTPADVLINLGWISRMKSPFFHPVLAMKPTDSPAVIEQFRQRNNKIDVLPDTPTTLTFSETPYFIKTDAANPQGQKYFPLAP